MNHHAVLHVAPSLLDAKLPSYLQDDAVESDFAEFELLTVEQVRLLKERAYQSPRFSHEQTLVIFTKRLTVEAQNALLKILEEPPQTTRFIFVVPSISVLLPTVRSRLFYEAVQDNQCVTPEVVDNFLHASVSERLAQIASLAKSEKGTGDVRSLLRSVVSSTSVSSLRNSAEVRSVVSFASQYQDLPGASPKFLLELIATHVPTVRR